MRGTSVSLSGISNYWFFNNVFLLKNHEFHLPLSTTWLTNKIVCSIMCDSGSKNNVRQIRNWGAMVERVGGVYKQRRARHTCVCAWCNHIFQATRPDAKTCCAAHRKALSRYLKNRPEVFNIVDMDKKNPPRQIVINSRQMRMFAEL